MTGKEEGGNVLNELVVLLGSQPKDSLSEATFQQAQVWVGGYSQGYKRNKWELVGLTAEGFQKEVTFELGSNMMRLRGIAVGERPLRR